jgi:methionine-rich copper-binding protein CopC
VLKGSRALLVTVLAIGSAMLAMLAGPAPVAWGHAELIGSVPASGATLPAAPSAVTLTFSDPIDQRFVRTAVTGPGGTAASSATASGPKVTVPLPAQGPGSYRLDYRVVSADGHPISGRLAFMVAGAPVARAPAARLATGAAAGSATAAAAGQAAAQATGEAAGKATGQADDGGGPSVVLVGLVIGLVVAAGAGGLWLALGRERRG